ncbi:protein FAM177B [Dunckerocampus dactyliophorus]|uniref:protein FAM177B n=1 Tax=Dunckerocampus dactyliophorus TaxID=161453 RepID=UPI00240655FE|nr:protein FAM177B [Dunckerocampus dactyliophorus]XP_054617343.1 protein FAM177B [Dunckerocampus dactyliophorus]XP_054617344.1 protein FAM177B [Dunckerocampus dactyliophorus]
MTDPQEPEHEAAGLSNQKKVIIFSSGESLTDRDSDDEEEEEEQEEEESSNEEAAGMFSVRSLVQLIGRLSLMTCDFIGGRLSCALGLNASKFQYAIDGCHRELETTTRQSAEDHTEEEKATPVSPSTRSVFHEATGDCCCSDVSQTCDDTDMAAM